SHQRLKHAELSFVLANALMCLGEPLLGAASNDPRGLLRQVLDDMALNGAPPLHVQAPLGNMAHPRFGKPCLVAAQMPLRDALTTIVQSHAEPARLVDDAAELIQQAVFFLIDNPVFGRQAEAVRPPSSPSPPVPAWASEDSHDRLLATPPRARLESSVPPVKRLRIDSADTGVAEAPRSATLSVPMNMAAAAKPRRAPNANTIRRNEQLAALARINVPAASGQRAAKDGTIGVDLPEPMRESLNRMNFRLEKGVSLDLPTSLTPHQDKAGIRYGNTYRLSQHYGIQDGSRKQFTEAMAAISEAFLSSRYEKPVVSGHDAMSQITDDWKR
ncbi:MAG: hypothetical protein JWQ11_3669, partial [Rhizobacter sp.]|nr:hypothetical protein [Rhizobacter sp.]